MDILSIFRFSREGEGGLVGGEMGAVVEGWLGGVVEGEGGVWAGGKGGEGRRGVCWCGVCGWVMGVGISVGGAG